MRSYRTQWAAQFAVASELCKRDFRVSLTLGNNPEFDLMVMSTNKVPFPVEVKGLYKRAFWQMEKKPLYPKLFYVFAYVPDNEPNQFFIMKQETVNDIIDAWANRKGPPPPQARLGVPWELAKKHKDAWRILPGYKSLPQSK
jgi:hypothetical protein